MKNINDFIEMANVIKKLYIKLYECEIDQKGLELYNKTLDNIRLAVIYENLMYSRIKEEEIDKLEANIINSFADTEYNFDIFDPYDRVFDRLKQRHYEICDLKITYPSYCGMPLDFDNSMYRIRMDYENLYSEIITAAIDYMSIKDIENDFGIAKDRRLFYKYKLAFENNSVETTMLNYNFDINKIEYDKYIEYIDNFKNKKLFNDVSYKEIREIIVSNINSLLELNSSIFPSYEEYKFNYTYLVHVIDILMKLLDSDKLKYIKNSLTNDFLSMESDVPLLTLQLFDKNISYREKLENEKKLVK